MTGDGGPRRVAEGHKERIGDPRGNMAAAGRGLDWFNLFVANIQTGFGPFIAVYLISQRWTQTSIGLALSIGTVAAMASQVPAGALVDAIPEQDARRRIQRSGLHRLRAHVRDLSHPPVCLSRRNIARHIQLHPGPAIAAMSLVITGRFGMGLRLGRNARYAAIGNGVGALLMGACGQYVSERAVFYLTAAFTLPALVALLPLRRAAVAAGELRPAPRRQGQGRTQFLHVLAIAACSFSAAAPCCSHSPIRRC